MNRKIYFCVYLSLILLLAGCKSAEELTPAVTIITRTATLTPSVTTQPTFTLFASRTPTSTPSPPTSTNASTPTQSIYDQTVEALSTYHDPDYGFSISYPSNWKKVDDKEFRGDDGYLRIQGIDDYHTASGIFVCADYIYQKYFGEKYYDDIAIVPYIIGCHANVKDLNVNIDWIFSEKGFDYFVIEIMTTPLSSADFMMIANSYIQDEDAKTKRLVAPENNETYSVTLPTGVSIREEFGNYVESLSSFDKWGADSRYSSWDGLRYEGYEYCIYMSYGKTKEVTYNGDVFEISNDSFWGGYTTIKRNNEVIYFEPSFKIMLGGNLLFCPWENHWILEHDGYLVQDGVILNHKFGYEDMFGWTLLANQPFYFFVDDGMTYVSYNGETLPISYDIVPHYRCCDVGANERPKHNSNKAWFFGRRDGAWYKTLISIEN